MASNYPGALDTLSNPASGDALNAGSGHAAQHANANDAIEAIEAELGTNPKGASASVKARLDAVDTAVSGKLAASAVSAFGLTLVDDADAATARTTLGLGGAATLNVGTSAGTVAAGDDSRLIGNEKTANKGAASGYAPLNANANIDVQYIPISWIDRQAYFGDGGDGNVTVSSGTTTVTRTMYYSNLTISGTGQIAHANNAIFAANTFTCSTSGTPAIKHTFLTAANGGNGAAVTTAGTAGSATAVGEFAANTAGNAGTASSATTGTAVAVVAALAQAAGGSNASTASGSGGAGAGGAGGAGRTPNGVTLPMVFHRPTHDFRRGVTLVPGGAAGAGGGGGGGNGTTAGAGGGGSGAAGSMGFLAARIIDVSSGSGVVFSVEPATSGAGGLTSTTNAGGGGGAQGSSGGWLTVIYETVVGSRSNAFVADGADGGAGGNGNGTGIGGSGGGGGTAGTIKVFDIGRETVTTATQSVAPTAGGAASGTTGGSPGTKGQCRFDLVATP